LAWFELEYDDILFRKYYLRKSSIGNFRYSGNHSSSKAWILILGNFALLERLVLFQNL